MVSPGLNIRLGFSAIWITAAGITPPGKQFVTRAGALFAEGKLGEVIKCDSPGRSPEKICSNEILRARTNVTPGIANVTWIKPALIVVPVVYAFCIKAFGVIVRIHQTAEGQLLFVIHATDAFGPLLRLGKGGQQHGCQNGDDRDDDQQFDQGKTGRTFYVICSRRAHKL